MWSFIKVIDIEEHRVKIGFAGKGFDCLAFVIELKLEIYWYGGWLWIILKAKESGES